MVQDLSIPQLHLLEGVGGIERSNGDVATVYNAQSFIEDRVIAATFFLAQRASAYSTRAESSAGSVRGAGSIGEPENGNVEGLLNHCQGCCLFFSFWRNTIYASCCDRQLDIAAPRDEQMS